MGSHSISNAPVPGFSKDLRKKKKTNKLAKLKQSKLDVRREQWLSQVKNKGCIVDSNRRGGLPPSSFLITDEGSRSLQRVEMRSKEVDVEGSSVHESDLESLMSSPVGSSMGQNDSMKDFPGSSCSSASSRCCSGNVSETEEDDGCLDDWEVVADALTANEKQHSPNLESPSGFKTKIGLADPELPNKNSGSCISRTECKTTLSGAQVTCQAWRPDDAFRPVCLPNLLKQYSLTTNPGHGAITQARQSITCQPSSCPICYEDLDSTDSSFLPCRCGFRLCLFCHKRILEADGRCPGCRKQYDLVKVEAGFNGEVTSSRMGRSFSMSTRC